MKTKINRQTLHLPISEEEEEEEEEKRRSSTWPFWGLRVGFFKPRLRTDDHDPGDGLPRPESPPLELAEAEDRGDDLKKTLAKCEKRTTKGKTFFEKIEMEKCFFYIIHFFIHIFFLFSLHFQCSKC